MIAIRVRIRLAAQLVQRAIGDQPSLGDDPDAIGHALGDLQDMGRHDHGAPGPHTLPQHFLDDARRTGVEAGERLVQDDESRVMHQRARQRHFLPHAPGQALAAFPGVGHQAQPVEQAARPRRGDRGIDRPQPGYEVEIFQRRQLLVDHRFVRDPGHDPPGGDGIGQRVDAVDRDRSAIRAEQAGDHPQRGRLARAVGAEQRVELPGGDTQVQTVHGGTLEPFREPPYVERGRRRVLGRVLARARRVDMRRGGGPVTLRDAVAHVLSSLAPAAYPDARKVTPRCLIRGGRRGPPERPAVSTGQPEVTWSWIRWNIFTGPFGEAGNRPGGWHASSRHGPDRASSWSFRGTATCRSVPCGPPVQREKG